jgi:hypothetical protein
MKAALLAPMLVSGLAVGALGPLGCAEVYIPRPSGAITLTTNGGSGYRVFKNGEEMGSDWAVADAVAGDPKAEAQAEKANSERVGSYVTGIVGSLAEAASAGILIYSLQSNNGAISNDLAGASIGLVAGGIVLDIIAGALSGAARTHMFNAVNIYNDDAAARATTRPVLVEPPPGAYLVPPRRGAGEVLITPGPGYAPAPAAPAPLAAPPAQ